MNALTEILYTAPNNGGVLHYKLIATPDLDGLSRVWSLAIIRLEADGEIESCLLYDIARTAESADLIGRLFCRNGVTPCCAAEILDDLLASLDQSGAVNSATSSSVR